LRLDEDAQRRIQEASWPGNIRELANALERAAILAEGETIRGADLAVDPAPQLRSGPGTRTMVEIEEVAIRKTLAEVGGNRRRAAERLGIGVWTLYEKLKKYGIQ
jgi:two-component system response regulator FlrC